MEFQKCPECGSLFSGKEKKCSELMCGYELNKEEYDNHLEKIELHKLISHSLFSPIIEKKLSSHLKGIENRMIHHYFRLDKNYDEMKLIETLISELDSVFYPVNDKFKYIVLAQNNLSSNSFNDDYILFAYVGMFFVKYEISSSTHDKCVRVNNIEYGFITKNDKISKSKNVRTYDDVELTYNNRTEKYKFKYKRTLKGDLNKLYNINKNSVGKAIDKTDVEKFKSIIETCFDIINSLYKERRTYNELLQKQNRALFKNKKKIKKLKEQISICDTKIYEEYDKLKIDYESLINKLK